MFQVSQKSFFIQSCFVLLLAICVVAPIDVHAACVGGGAGAGVGGGGNVDGGGYIVIGSGDNCNTGGLFGGGGFLGLDNPYGLPSGSIFGIIANIVNWLLALFGLLGILGFVISGVMYLISAGDEKMAERAKDGLKYSIIGIIVGLSGFIVMQAINGLLSGVAGTY